MRWGSQEWWWNNPPSEHIFKPGIIFFREICSFWKRFHFVIFVIFIAWRKYVDRENSIWCAYRYSSAYLFAWLCMILLFFICVLLDHFPEAFSSSHYSSSCYAVHLNARRLVKSVTQLLLNWIFDKNYFEGGVCWVIWFSPFLLCASYSPLYMVASDGESEYG